MVATWINAGKKCMIHEQGSLLVGVIHQRWDTHGTNLKTKRASYGTTGHLIFQIIYSQCDAFSGDLRVLAEIYVERGQDRTSASLMSTASESSRICSLVFSTFAPSFHRLIRRSHALKLI